MEYLPCPHCGRPFAASGVAKHALTCLEKPGMLERIRQALEDPERPGHARDMRSYDVVAAKLGAPSYSTLHVHWGATGAICERVGLQWKRKHGPTRGALANRREVEERAIREVEAALEADGRLREEMDGRGLPVCGYRVLPNGDEAWVLR